MLKVLALFYPGCIAREILPAIRALEGRCEIHYATPDGTRLLEMKDAPEKPLAAFSQRDGGQYRLVLVPGGDPAAVIGDAAVTRLLRAADEVSALFGAVCAGPSVLAQAGVLKGRRIAHGYDAWQIDWLRERGVFTDCEVTDESFVRDDRVITAKPNAFEEFTAAIVREIEREERAVKTFLVPTRIAIPHGSFQIIERPGWFEVWDPNNPGPSSNEVFYSSLADADLERVVDESVAKHRKVGHALKWCTGPLTRPRRTGDVLTSHGFESWWARGMGCDPQKLRLEIPPHARVEEVTELNLIPYAETFMAGKTDSVTRFREILGRKNWAHFVVSCDGKFAGRAGVVVVDDYAYLFGAEVLEPFRDRGLYRALLEARLAFLRERGISLAVTQAREATSAPRLEKLGFETFYRARIFLLPS